MQKTENGFRSLFDGKTLKGWYPAPRLPIPQTLGGPEPNTDGPHYKRAAASKGAWTVVDGAIEGRQDPPDSGLGGYLMSEEKFGDFELIVEANPDWPADTGVMVRTLERANQGFQILVDHRHLGNIGGVYGNGMGGFHAIGHTVALDTAGSPHDPEGVTALRLGTLEEAEKMAAAGKARASFQYPIPEKKSLLSYAAPGEEFLAAWKWRGWNEFRIIVKGELPVITVFINGVKISEIDTAAIVWPNYPPAEEMRKVFGGKGHIAFEVHDLGQMGRARWGENAACRWRNIRIREF